MADTAGGFAMRRKAPCFFNEYNHPPLLLQNGDRVNEEAGIDLVRREHQ